MKRITCTPTQLDEGWFSSLGCTSLIGKSAWHSNAYYSFTSQEIATLKQAGTELEAMCLHAVEHVISNRLYDVMLIPSSECFRQQIERSWEQQEPSFCGRLDLAYDGKSPPKLLEYNAERPGLLLESALLQKGWITKKMPQTEQFNDIESLLIDAWQALNMKEITICLIDTAIEISEENDILALLCKTAQTAGVNTQIVPRRLIQTDKEQLFTAEGNPIRHMLITHDWYEMLASGLLACFSPHKTRIVEPAWRALLSNKAILKILWDMYPDHPYLLRTTLHPEDMGGTPYVSKPILGYWGENVAFHNTTQPLYREGRFSAFPRIYQQLSQLPYHDSHYAQTGMWLIGGKPAGLNIREDATPVINHNSISLPHTIEDQLRGGGVPTLLSGG